MCEIWCVTKWCVKDGVWQRWCGTKLCEWDGGGGGGGEGGGGGGIQNQKDLRQWKFRNQKWQHRSARSCYCAKEVVKKRLSFKPYPSLPADGPPLCELFCGRVGELRQLIAPHDLRQWKFRNQKWQHRSARSCYCTKQVVKKRLSFKPYPSLPADGPRLVRTLLRPSRRTSTAHRAARSEAMEISEPKMTTPISTKFLLSEASR